MGTYQSSLIGCTIDISENSKKQVSFDVGLAGAELIVVKSCEGAEEEIS